MLLGDHEHAARTTAGVVDCADDSLALDLLLVAREHEVDHEVDDVAGREVLAGVLVHRLVELAQELLEDSAHRRVVDQLGMEIDVLEALHDLENESRLVELADRVVEIEFLDDLAHVGAETRDVVAEIGRKVGGVARQPLEIVARGVVEGEARSLAQLGVEVLETLAAEFGLALEDLFLGRREDAVEAPQHREGKDDVLVLAPLEGVADEVRDAPDKADDLAVVHARSELVLV